MSQRRQNRRRPKGTRVTMWLALFTLLAIFTTNIGLVLLMVATDLWAWFWWRYV